MLSPSSLLHFTVKKESLYHSMFFNIKIWCYRMPKWCSSYKICTNFQSCNFNFRNCNASMYYQLSIFAIFHIFYFLFKTGKKITLGPASSSSLKCNTISKFLVWNCVAFYNMRHNLILLAYINVKLCDRISMASLWNCVARKYFIYLYILFKNVTQFLLAIKLCLLCRWCMGVELLTVGASQVRYPIQSNYYSQRPSTNMNILHYSNLRSSEKERQCRLIRKRVSRAIL